MESFPEDQLTTKCPSEDYKVEGLLVVIPSVEANLSLG